MTRQSHFDDADTPRPFSSPEWHMKVESNGGLDGMCNYHIDVYRGTAFMCRIALSGHFPNQAAAEEALDRRLKAWLEDYEGRPRPAGDDHVSYDTPLDQADIRLGPYRGPSDEPR